MPMLENSKKSTTLERNEVTSIGHYLSFRLFATFIVLIFFVHLYQLWSFRGELLKVIPPMIFWNILTFIFLFISIYIESYVRNEHIPTIFKKNVDKNKSWSAENDEKK